MKRLPVGMQTFKEIINKDCLYIDKTKYIYNILKTYKCCFLSRPRRFGKSLILSTFEAIFQEDREFFDGLWIGSSDYKFKKHPVIRLSMDLGSTSVEELNDDILLELKIIANLEGLSIDSTNNPANPRGTLSLLINHLFNKYNKEVVILIDEYDKPVIDNLDNLENAEKINSSLKKFFGALKSCDSIIQMIFFTGVTKCALTSASASLNNLKDISILPEYSTLCGFTLDEIKTYFSDRIDDVYEIIKLQKDISPNYTKEDLWKNIINWYDGYNFSGHFNVFNPWSIINFFDEKKFKTYWLATGTSSIITNLIRKNPEEYTSARLESYTAKMLDTTDLGKLEPVPMLFTYGYLTLDEEITNKDGETGYSLKVPNLEIKKDFHIAEMEGIFGLKETSVNILAKEFNDAVFSRKSLAIETMIGSNLASITADKHNPQEKFYHALVQSFLNGFDLWPRSEDYGSIGKSDIVLVIPEKIYVIIEIKYVNDEVEIKLEKSTTVLRKLSEMEKQTAMEKASQRALDQIEDKAYYKKFEAQAKEIIKVGLVVCGKHEVKVVFA